MKNSLTSKIKTHIRLMHDDFIRDMDFSFGYASQRVVGTILETVRMQKMASIVWNKRNETIICYLTNELSDVIERTKHDGISAGKKEVDPPIWVCWWQGIDNAPIIVKRSINQLMMNANGHNVHIITKENVEDFISIPMHILNQVNRGEISLANLADYIRASLLLKYGGMWIDGTVYTTQAIPEDYYSFPFFSISSERYDGYYIAGGRWTTYVLGGWKGNSLYRFIKESMECHYNNHKHGIDYFLIDYLIEIAYREFPEIKEMIEDVPQNNPHRYSLRDALLVECPAKQLQDVIYHDTVFYKLTYKANYGAKRPDGKKTIYEQLFAE